LLSLITSVMYMKEVWRWVVCVV